MNHKHTITGFKVRGARDPVYCAGLRDCQDTAVRVAEKADMEIGHVDA